MLAAQHNSSNRRVYIFSALAALALFGGGVLRAQTQTTLTVLGSDKASVGDFRWLIEEDRTVHVTPGKSAFNNTLAVRFHESYMPLVAKGEGRSSQPLHITLPNANKHYFISVMPSSSGTYAIGGAPIAPGQTEVTVTLNKLPNPTAQITVFAFEDTSPINNAPDIPAEHGLGGFQVVLVDAGGRYGVSGGEMMFDNWNNPLGTVYRVGPNGSAILDSDGNPIPETDAFGKPVVRPMVTGACPGPECGSLTIKNLAPGKYTVFVIPPYGSGYQQTATIEGTRGNDAWVKANEPRVLSGIWPSWLAHVLRICEEVLRSSLAYGLPVRLSKVRLLASICRVRPTIPSSREVP